jgi:hypothetical protein
MRRDENTYGSVGDKYDEYSDIRAARPEPAPRGLPPQRPYTPPAQHSDMGRTVFAAIGIGIGVILLILAIISFMTAARWSGLGREGAAVGYIVVGFFLTLAGLGGIIATYNHNFRVLVRRAGHSH